MVQDANKTILYVLNSTSKHPKILIKYKTNIKKCLTDKILTDTKYSLYNLISLIRLKATHGTRNVNFDFQKVGKEVLHIEHEGLKT